MSPMNGFEATKQIRKVSPESKIIAVRHQNIMATSFHPEVTDDLRIHRYFVDLVRAAQ